MDNFLLVCVCLFRPGYRAPPNLKKAQSCSSHDRGSAAFSEEALGLRELSSNMPTAGCGFSGGHPALGLCLLAEGLSERGRSQRHVLPRSVCFQKVGTLPLMETQLTNEALMTKRTEGFSLFLSFEEKIPLDSPECHSVL